MEKVFLALIGGVLFGGAAVFGFNAYNESTEKTPSLAEDSKAGPVDETAWKKKLADMQAERDRYKERYDDIRSKKSKVGKVRSTPRIEVEAKGDLLTDEVMKEAMSILQQRKDKEAAYAKRFADGKKASGPKLQALLDAVELASTLTGDDEISKAAKAENGKLISALFSDLKALGPGAHGAIFEAYSKIFVDKDGNPVRDWRELGQIRNQIGMDREVLNNLVTDELYTSILSGKQGIAPPMLMQSALWRIDRDPTMNAEERDKALNGVFDSYSEDAGVVGMALRQLSNEEARSAKALELINKPGASPAVQASAINALPRELNDSMVDQLRTLENSGSPEVQDNARHALQRNNPVTTGYLVRGVTGNSAAASAGLRKGDIIMSIAGKPMSGGNSINAVKRDLKPGDTVTIKINRGGQEVTQQISINEAKRFGVDGDAVKQGERQTRNRWGR